MSIISCILGVTKVELGELRQYSYPSEGGDVVSVWQDISITTDHGEAVEIRLHLENGATSLKAGSVVAVPGLNRSEVPA